MRIAERHNLLSSLGKNKQKTSEGGDSMFLPYFDICLQVLAVSQPGT
jgi:hypothetical protein